MALFPDLFNSLLSHFPKLKALFDLSQRFVEHFTGVFSAGSKLFTSTISEFEAWKNFKEDVRLKSRVVNIERAITKTKELISGLISAWNSVVDLAKKLTTRIELTADAEAVEAATGIGLPIALVNAIVVILEVVDLVRSVIDDLQSIVDEITRIRQAIESADTIFLSQSNKRKTLKLEDGGSIKIRLGKLHS